ncbi:MAG: hypothetical protein J7K72_02870 [Candidatus Aenigmarchaeota archaeon]|nr:hypothetical protein [Candidatus Aenigmarchaeota archaeon]
MFSKLYEKIINLITWLEKDRLSLSGMFFLVLAIGLIRGYIEAVCFNMDYANMIALISNDIMAAFSGFFGACVGIAFFARERIKKVANIFIFGFFVFILPPKMNTLLFGGCLHYSYNFAFLHNANGITIIDLVFFPLFILKTGLSPGLVFEMCAAYPAIFLYVLIKSRSWKRSLILIPAMYAFTYIQAFAPIFYFTFSQFEILRMIKFLPPAYLWYFLLFVFFSLIGLLLSKKFTSIMIKTINIRFLLFIAILTSIGTAIPHIEYLQYLNSIDLLVKIFISTFLWSSFAILLKFWGGKKHRISSLILDGTIDGRSNDKRLVEVAIIFQGFAALLSIMRALILSQIFLFYITATTVFMTYLFIHLKAVITKRKAMIFFSIMAFITGLMPKLCASCEDSVKNMLILILFSILFLITCFVADKLTKH